MYPKHMFIEKIRTIMEFTFIKYWVQCLCRFEICLAVSISLMMPITKWQKYLYMTAFIKSNNELNSMIVKKKVGTAQNFLSIFKVFFFHSSNYKLEKIKIY